MCFDSNPAMFSDDLYQTIISDNLRQILLISRNYHRKTHSAGDLSSMGDVSRLITEFCIILLNKQGDKFEGGRKF